MEIKDLVGLGSVPLVIAFGEFLKRVWPGCPAYVAPWLILAFSISFQILLALKLVASDPVQAAIYGLIAGFAAIGVYEWSKTPAKASAAGKVAP